ncbi:MAG: leucine-rich repeat domain-containing protein [Clostridia bacterium]|nr:leucine-rich repeat domain-containing protein [Clostridia bacterium]
MKKLLTLLLVLIMSLSAFSLFACGDTGSGSGNGGGETPPGTGNENTIVGTEGLTYSITGKDENRFASLTGLKADCTEKDIIVASHFEGVKVTTIGSALGRLNNFNNVESIKIHEGVTNIKASAFNLSNSVLKTITFDEDCVISIGASAFKGCPKLETIEFPKKIISVGEGAFERCPSLKTTEYFGAEYLGNEKNPYLFLIKGMPNETNCKINAGCQIIYSSAFESIIYKRDDKGNPVLNANGQPVDADGNALVDEKGQAKPETIYKLTNIIFESEENLNYIGDYAFRRSQYLKEIKIPASCTGIGIEAFKENIALEKVIFAEENNKMSKMLNEIFVSCTALKAVENFEYCIIEKISDRTFYKCGKLESIVIPNTVKVIGERVLTNCSSLKSVTFEEDSQLIEIGTNAFRACTSLSSIIIPKTVTTIGFDPFVWTNVNRSLVIYCEVTECTGVYATDRFNNRIGSHAPAGKMENGLALNANGQWVDPEYLKTYYYSETYKAGDYWRYVNGVPMPWN